MELSYCVVNTNGRELLLSCLEAIRGTHPAGIEHEILVLDNASDDGSAEAVARRFPEVRVIARDRRAGLAENNSLLLREARGRFCLLLNEDSEILEGAARGPARGAAGRSRGGGGGRSAPGRRRPTDPLRLAISRPRHRAGPGAVPPPLAGHPGAGTSGRRRRLPREVGWVQSCTMLVRREAAQRVGYLDPDFFVYSEEVDFQKRMRDAGWRILHVPAARAIHHEQLATDRSAGARRVVQFHRGRAMYMRKHHSRPVGLPARMLWAWSYVPRAIAAVFMPGHDPAGTGSTPARRCVPPVARGCARRPRRTTRSWPALGHGRLLQAPPRSSSRATTS